jgi:sec-independent protein translocase protein TatC
LGIAFSFYIIAPISIHFLYNYQITDLIQNNFTMDSHIGLVTNMLLGVSILFELPVLVFFLTKIGLITPAFLKKYRKHALVVVLIVAAIITPPDVASQIIVAIPIVILYEVSIKVSKIVIKKQQKNAHKSKRV